MLTIPRKNLPAVIGVLIVSLALPSQVQARGRQKGRPSPLFTGTSIPEPPMQKKPWTPPQTRLPESYVSAITVLFQQGLADPRGCELRQVTITLGSVWSGDAGTGTTRAWVLPEKPGEKHRFAVVPGGFVYPVISVGKKLDLKTEVQAAIRAAKKEKDAAATGRRESVDSSDERDGAFSGLFAEAFLLRLGEGELADALWEATTRADNDGEKAKEYYSSLASNWAWGLFEDGLTAHMRGDDVIALHHFRLLSSIAGPVEEEAKKRGYKPDENRRKEKLLDFLEQLQDLLADQERRAKRGPLPPVVCIGPGREANQDKRIAALVERLEEVSARQWGQPGGVNLGDDPVVQALVREGEPAIEPLLACFEKDNRLTRSVHFWRDFARSRTALAVHEAAYVALGAILHRSDYEPVAT
jgi:hypothetical protein